MENGTLEQMMHTNKDTVVLLQEVKRKMLTDEKEAHQSFEAFFMCWTRPEMRETWAMVKVGPH